MKGPRYRPFDYDTFAAWMAEIGFIQAPRRKDTWEYVWERPVNCSFSTGRYVVRIYSSVSYHDKMSRDVGGDAVRIQLIDTLTDRPMRLNGMSPENLSYRVYRTENCHQNTLARARDAYGYVLRREHHCECGGLMVARDGRNGQFMGCSSYPKCMKTKSLSAVAA